MNYPAIQINGSKAEGSQNQASFTHTRRALRSSLVLAAVTLAACGGDSASPTAPVATGRATTPPFSVQLRVDDLDELSNRCDIRVIASTRGGQTGAVAEWGILSGSSFDAVTHQQVGVSRTLPLYPEVFDVTEIQRGEEANGIVDLALFRREAGARVSVELEFHYTVIGDNGSSSGTEQVAKLSHECE